MSFVDTFFANLKKNPSRPFVTEVHGARLERTHGGRLAELIAHAKKSLAHYKIPKRIVFVEDLPRNASGKILKRELA